MPTSVDIAVGNGTYTFCITIKGAREIEEACRAKIGEVRARLLQGVYAAKDSDDRYHLPQEAAYGIDDILEPIRQGLLGGKRGVVDDIAIEIKPHDVDRIMRNYIHEMAWDDVWKVAAFVMERCAAGYTPPEKKNDGLKASETS